LKVAISGKGGVGKTTVAALVAAEFARRGRNVTAIDADPNPTLGPCLGFASLPAALLEMADEIEERVGSAGVIRLNPRVDDLVDRIAIRRDGLTLIVAGSVTHGGAGCACPQSVLLRRLLEHVVVGLDDAVVIDLEAGLEHLGRRTAEGADALLVVADPANSSLETARRITRLATEIGLRRVALVANRVHDPADLAFIEERASGIELAGVIPYSQAVLAAERAGRSLFDLEDGVGPAVGRLVDALVAPSLEAVPT
jgi:CO dehydrogenase maturation factor